MIYVHDFKDGSIIRIVEKAFGEEKVMIPTIQFQFRDNENHNMTLEVPMYDEREGVMLLPEFAETLNKYLGIVPELEKIEEVVEAPKVEEEVEEPKVTKKVKKKTPKNLQKALKDKRCTDCQEMYRPASPSQKRCNICRTKRTSLKEAVNA